MPFILKQLNNFNKDDGFPLPLHYTGTIKIGSGSDCDMVITYDKQILPFHCELYHRGLEFRFVAAHSAFVEINDSDILKWPAVLKDGDILTIGTTKFQFNIIKPIPRRSWRSSFAAYSAVTLLISLLLFEICIITWLPYTLNKREAWEFSTAKQYVVRQIDKLRSKTNRMSATGQDETSLKNLLQTCENSIASYLRKYADKMNREQTRSIHKSLYKLETIIDQWPHYKKSYILHESINPDTYIVDLCSYLEKQTHPDGTITVESETPN